MAAQHYSELKENVLQSRAIQIYAILISAAYNRQTTTYGIIADLLGYGGAGVLDRQLGLILHWCADNDLPPLTVLVVNQSTGLPGEGFGDSITLHSDREKVFNYPWFDLLPPTIAELNVYGSLR